MKRQSPRSGRAGKTSRILHRRNIRKFFVLVAFAAVSIVIATTFQSHELALGLVNNGSRDTDSSKIPQFEKFDLSAHSNAAWTTPKNQNLRIAILSTYVPQVCEIGAFAFEVLAGIRSVSQHSFLNITANVFVISPEEYKDTGYAQGASFVIRRNIFEDFLAAAAFSNSHYDVVICEHEFGMYGGYIGDYLFAFLHRLKIPFIVTLHTVLSHLDVKFLDLNLYHEHMKHLLSKASWVTVGLHSLCYELEDLVPGAFRKCSYIPSGIPRSVPNNSSILAKYGHLLRGKLVILTAGLLGPSKGIDVMIEAMHDISARVPSSKYFVVGQEHPLAHLNYLQTLRKETFDHLAIRNVEFVDDSMSRKDLEAWATVADVIVLPYRDPGQIHSAPLMVAVGLGKPVVATRFKHSLHLCLKDNLVRRAWKMEAAEVVSGRKEDKAGLEGHYCSLVDREDPKQLATVVISLLEDKGRREELSRLARERTREMSWVEAARKLIGLCARAVDQFEREFSAPKWVKLPLIPASGQPLTNQGKLLLWANVLHRLRLRDPTTESLETRDLLRYLQSCETEQLLNRQLAVLALQSLSYRGLLFSRWSPPSVRLHFNLRDSGFFLLKDSVKSIHGNLKDGVVVVSRAEHGLVFGRGPSILFPGVQLDLKGKPCAVVDSKRDLKWDTKVNSTVAVLWTSSEVVCVGLTQELAVATLVNRIVARVDEPFVKHSVELSFHVPSEEVQFVEVSSKLGNMSTQFNGVYYSRAFLYHSDGSQSDVVPMETDSEIYRRLDSKLLSMVLVSSEEGKNSVFVRPESRNGLSSIMGWVRSSTKLQRHRSVIDELQFKYAWHGLTQSIIAASEWIMVAGRTDSSRMMAYNTLFEQEGRFPGVDYSVVEEKESLLEAVERYWLLLARNGTESQDLLLWLREHGSRIVEKAV